MKHYLIGMDATRELEDGQTMVIGRAPDCFWVLNNLHTSRKHAQLTLENGTCILRDLNSSGGTIINNKLIDEIALQHGDQIQIASQIFCYCAKDDPAEVQRLEQALREQAKAARTISKSDLKEAAPDSDFSGSLGNTALWEICQMLEVGGKSGRLTVRDEVKKGSLYFSEGAVIGAEYQDEHGIPAATHVLKMQEGHFAFSHGDFTPSQPLAKPLMSLTLEALMQNEGGKLDIGPLDSIPFS